MRFVAICSSVLVLAGCQPLNDRPLFAPYPTPAYTPPRFNPLPPALVPLRPYAAPLQDAPLIGGGPPGPTPLVLPSMRPSDRPALESRPPGETSEPMPLFERPDDPTPPLPDPDAEEKRARMYRELHGDPS